MWFSKANQQVSKLVCFPFFPDENFCGYLQIIVIIICLFVFFSQIHIPADWRCTAVIWDSPKWPVKIPECLTVRSLETTSLVKSELHWQFWVRVFLYYNLTTRFYRFLQIAACQKPSSLLHWRNSLFSQSAEIWTYATQCLHLHLCVKFHLRWRRANKPPWAAMMLMAHLRPLTSGTKTASPFQRTPARSPATRTPPTLWTPTRAVWFVTSSCKFIIERVSRHWTI